MDQRQQWWMNWPKRRRSSTAPPGSPANQDAATGMWDAKSLNKNRPSESDPALFMSDAATGYAALALQAIR